MTTIHVQAFKDATGRVTYRATLSVRGTELEHARRYIYGQGTESGAFMMGEGSTAETALEALYISVGRTFVDLLCEARQNVSVEEG